MEQNPVIECKISVRELVGFVLKSGSIDNRFGGRPNRMQDVYKRQLERSPSGHDNPHQIYGRKPAARIRWGCR